MIDGLATPITVNGARLFGVVLPASTAVCPDEALIRSILVHEFSHCFWYNTLILNHLDAVGENIEIVDEFNPFSKTEDDERIVEPADWFGPEDAESILDHDDPRLGQLVTAAAGLLEAE